MMRYKLSLDRLISLRDTLNSLNQRHFCLLAKTNNEYDVQMTQDYICTYVYFRRLPVQMRNFNGKKYAVFRDHNNIITYT